jgi:hypothetical protein
MGVRGVVGSYPGGAFFNSYADATWINLVPASCRGTMRTLDLYVRTAGTCKIKIFRDDGTNFVFITESSPFYLAVGEQLNFANPSWMTIEKDQLIGLFSTNLQVWADFGYGTYKTRVKSGDVVTTTPKSEWTTYDFYLNLQGHIFSKGAFIL